MSLSRRKHPFKSCMCFMGRWHSLLLCTHISIHAWAGSSTKIAIIQIMMFVGPCGHGEHCMQNLYLFWQMPHLSSYLLVTVLVWSVWYFCHKLSNFEVIQVVFSIDIDDPPSCIGRYQPYQVEDVFMSGAQVPLRLNGPLEEAHTIALVALVATMETNARLGFLPVVTVSRSRVGQPSYWCATRISAYPPSANQITAFICAVSWRGGTAGWGQWV